MSEIRDSELLRYGPEVKVNTHDLVEIKSSYFDAYIYPGMSIVPANVLFIYRGGVLKEKLGDELYERFKLNEKQEVDNAYTSKGDFENNMISSQKISLRNISFEEKNDKVVAHADYVHGGVPFPLYKLVSDPNRRKELEMAMPTATAAVVITKDNKILIQNRSSENARYAETLGASAAGLWDKTIDNGKVVPPSTKSATENILKELQEEIGVEKKDLSSIIVTGISVDKVAVHTEVMFMARLNITSDELEVKANKNSNTSGGFDFGEKYLLLDATPEVVKTLLVDVKCHIPSTHAAALLSVGLAMYKDSIINKYDSLEASIKLSEYAKLITKEMDKNYKEIDLIAKKYWESNGKLYSKYEPMVKPSEQGLPDVYSELLRNNLIKGINTFHKEN